MMPQRKFLLGNRITLGEIWRRRQKEKHLCMLEDEDAEYLDGDLDL